MTYSSRDLTVFVLLGGVLAVGIPAQGQILLHATFDDKAVDVPIGTGGPAVGEPTWIADVTATVRATPLPSPSLEITDNDTYYAGSVAFSFTGDVEVTSGLLSVSADLWFAQYEGFDIFFREQDSAANMFLDLAFNSFGYVSAWDQGGLVVAAIPYAIGRVVPLRVLFDMDQGTYDVFLDGTRIVADESHNVVGAGVGVGRVFFGVTNDENLVGTLYVDNLTAATDDLVFFDAFETGTTLAWSSTVP
ncbi:MAG: hypothetical protein R6W83_00245 [Cryobacterium sp.]